MHAGWTESRHSKSVTNKKKKSNRLLVPFPCQSMMRWWLRGKTCRFQTRSNIQWITISPRESSRSRCRIEWCWDDSSLLLIRSRRKWMKQHVPQSGCIGGSWYKTTDAIETFNDLKKRKTISQKLRTANKQWKKDTTVASNWILDFLSYNFMRFQQSLNSIRTGSPHSGKDRYH